MNNRSKNHHFVPKVLQKPFAIEGKRIWFSERGKNNFFGTPEFRNINTAFCIKDHYTVLNGDSPSDIVERKFYGKIDNYWGKVLPFILGEFEKGTIPSFSGEYLERLRKVVVEMAKRTPDFTCSIDDAETGREIIENTLGALSNSPGNEEHSRASNSLHNPHKLKAIGRSVRVQAVIAHSPKIEHALKDFSVRWVVSKTRSSFILSSAMVYRIGNGGPNGMSNPKMEMWMPISPKIVLVLMRNNEQKTPRSIVDCPAHIRKVNEYAVRNSNYIASHSERLLKSLINK